MLHFCSGRNWTAIRREICSCRPERPSMADTINATSSPSTDEFGHCETGSGASVAQSACSQRLQLSSQPSTLQRPGGKYLFALELQQIQSCSHKRPASILLPRSFSSSPIRSPSVRADPGLKIALISAKLQRIQGKSRFPPRRMEFGSKRGATSAMWTMYAVAYLFCISPRM